MPKDFSHRALALKEFKPLVYTAISKHTFYYRMFITKFVLEQDAVPLNPYMELDYFLLDAVDRDTIRQTNNTYLHKCDAIWVFGPVSDGVLAEVTQAKEVGKPVRYFSVDHNQGIKEILQAEVIMEAEVDGHQDKL